MRRGHQFTAAKLGVSQPVAHMQVTDGQLAHEWSHLEQKVVLRSPAWLPVLHASVIPRAHPLFEVVPGPIEAWERA